jgi:hypothetical protein
VLDAVETGAGAAPRALGGKAVRHGGQAKLVRGLHQGIEFFLGECRKLGIPFTDLSG